MKIKKILAAVLVSILAIALVACGGKDEDKEGTGGSDKTEKTVLKVAALQSGYGDKLWPAIKEAYEKANEDVTIELTFEKNIEEVIRPKMTAGDYPDVVLLATGREQALTETLIREKGLEPLSDVLDMKVYGEDVTVKEKLIPGFTDTLATNPYGDGKTYLLPMFYSPTGLFYNAGLFAEKGWDVPTTWDEMWELGDKAAEEDIALFTYPTSGYFDGFTYSLLTAIGGPDFFNKAMSYEDGIWESDDANVYFDTVAKLAKYTEKTTVANANDQDFTRNQQLILDNKALFMPNGTWVVGEMGEAPRADGFEWGMTAVPGVNGSPYAYTFFEQVWVPAEAKQKDAAKEFLTYLYSDEAASIFAESNAIQPITGISDKLSEENQIFYSIYDGGANAVMGGFAATDPVPGVNMADTLFGTVDSIVAGSKTVDQWQKDVEAASDKLREAKK